ncbi:hypothetical protein PUN28_018151 [Cardiocondyla obscurior]|uniref:Uncharacterized protein n=1 Tax=Cardiocondyla obscurior TaxID=286306 RepID=A0AAW2EG21_9HYME
MNISSLLFAYTTNIFNFIYFLRKSNRCIRGLRQRSTRPAQMHTRSHGCPHTEIRIGSGTPMREYASFGFLVACVAQTRFRRPVHLRPDRGRCVSSVSKAHNK